MARALALLLLTLALGGCNMVVSPTPLFGPADAAGAPGLRSGLWVSGDPACRFDARTPVAAWPDCARPGQIENGRGKLLFGDEDEGEMLLAGGSPAILQVQMGGSDGDEGYAFLGLRPTRTDGAGRVVEYVAWVVDCGPPPPEDARNPDGSRRYVSLQPGPGLAVEDGGCVAHSAQAVRAAAVASEGRARLETFRWLRDRP